MLEQSAVNTFGKLFALQQAVKKGPASSCHSRKADTKAARMRCILMNLLVGVYHETLTTQS